MNYPWAQPAVSKTKAEDSESNMQWLQFPKIKPILAQRHKDTERITMASFTFRLFS